MEEDGGEGGEMGQEEKREETREELRREEICGQSERKEEVRMRGGGGSEVLGERGMRRDGVR